MPTRLSRSTATLAAVAMRWVAGFAMAVALLCPSAGATAQDIVMGSRYRQSAEVLARYPDVDLKMESPGLAPGRATFTSQEELDAFLAGLAQPNAPVVLQSLARTQQGRNLPLLIFTPERLTDPAAIKATGRPIVWLIGQQHGNEPAGGEAMLALAHELARGRLVPLLSKLVVIMVPRANPDGAAAETRDTAAKMDLNRDHASFALAETRAVHAAVQRYLPDLVVDAHEFSVAQRWIEKFGGLQAVDLMYLEATHPAVPEAIKALSREMFAPAIERAMHARQLSTFPYHTTSTRLADRSISLGGNAPGIARNAFGLMGAVSLLLETRGVGIGNEGFQRRVATHVIAIEAVLEAAAADRERLKRTVASVRSQIAQAPAPVILAAVPTNETVALLLVDPQTGERRTIEVVMANSRQASASKRPLPAAYVVLAEAKAIAAELKLVGVGHCIVTEGRDVDAEMFEIAERGTADRRSINPDAAVKATLRNARVHVPAGSLYIPMNQPMAHRAAAALEPDAPGSFVALDVVRVSADRVTAPIVRVARGADIRLVAPDVSAEANAACAAAR